MSDVRRKREMRDMIKVDIEMLKAYYGDCIFITVNYDSKEYIIMIDGGTGNTYTFKNKKRKIESGPLKEKIEKLKEEGNHIDLLIVTHVDDDHIGGVIKWFEDEIPADDFVRCIWLNDDLEVTEDKSLDNTSEQAASLKKALDKHSIHYEDRIVSGKVVIFDWGRIVVLAPTTDQHNVVAQDIAEALDNVTPDRYDVDIETILKEEYKGSKCTPENDASIAILLQTKDGENCLFLGDANIETVMTTLKDKDDIKLPLKCSWVKLSHHGSKNNFKPELLEIIDAENYIISTNGIKFGHPDKEVIAWLVDKTSANLYFNYPERAEVIFTEKDKEKYPELVQRIKSI